MPKLRAIPQIQLASAPLSSIPAKFRTFERQEHALTTEQSYWQAVLALPQM